MKRILTNGKNIPHGAILGGEDDGQPIFIARAFCAGGVCRFSGLCALASNSRNGPVDVGKAGRQFEQGAVIGYKRKEIQVTQITH